MSEQADCVIDVEAVKALAHWKSLFADAVALGARRLAAESAEHLVSLAHYRQAAQHALRSLPAAILEGGPSHDDQAA